MKIAIVGDVALELIAPYFRNEGYEVYVPAGFGAWRQELLDENSALHRFNPDYIYNVTEKENTLTLNLFEPLTYGELMVEGNYPCDPAARVRFAAEGERTLRLRTPEFLEKVLFNGEEIPFSERPKTELADALLDTFGI
jgi:hypothetical protein